MSQKYTSEHTPDKQCHFETIIRTHLRAGYGAIKKNYWAHRSYFYLDMYAGQGVYKDKVSQMPRIGSPLIFAMEAQKQNVPFDAYLMEEEEETINKLRGHLNDWRDTLLFWDKCYYECIHGDNREAVPDLLSTLQGSAGGHDAGKPRYGLVYVDPPGNIPPFETLQTIAADRRFKYTDILLYLSATNFKRFRKCASVTFSDYLEDALRGVGKEYIHIREYQGRHQWTFALLTNWAGMPEFSNIGFHCSDTPDRRKIMNALNFTAEELSHVSPVG